MAATPRPARKRRESSTKRGRPLVEWFVRGMLAMVAGIVGYVSVVHAIAASLPEAQLQNAQVLAPWDGRIAGARSAQLSGPMATDDQRARADRVARVALLWDPTAASAVATLGVNAQIRGDTRLARRLFAYSDQLSRRELRTRLWAIEDAVARNDIAGALHNYDVALRTSRFASDLLFPVLASAITDPMVERGLVRTLLRKPAWSEGFLAYLASTSDNPAAMASLFAALDRAGVRASDEVNAKALERLIASGSYQPAWSLYRQMRPGVDPHRSRDPRFALVTTFPTPFDWVPILGDNGVAASVQQTERGNVFDFSGPSGIGGVILQQAQIFPAGRFLLEGRSASVDQPPDTQPYFSLTCIDGRELGRVNIANSAQANGRFTGTFTVPTNCPAQYLRLVLRASSQVSGVSGQIVELSIRPLG